MRAYIFNSLLILAVIFGIQTTLAQETVDMETTEEATSEYRPIFKSYYFGGLNYGGVSRYSSAEQRSSGLYFAYENGGVTGSLLDLDFITTGGFLGYRSYGYDDNFFGDYNIGSYIIGARASVLIPQLLESINNKPLGLNFIEPYATVSFGYEYLAIDWAGYLGGLSSRTFVGVAVGARLYLLKNFGAYVEVGPNGQGFVQFGAILRLGEL